MREMIRDPLRPTQAHMSLARGMLDREIEGKGSPFTIIMAFLST